MRLVPPSVAIAGATIVPSVASGNLENSFGHHFFHTKNCRFGHTQRHVGFSENTDDLGK